MPKVKDRLRHCAHCGSQFSLDDPGALKKYCQVSCRNALHWKRQGPKYRASDKGKLTAFVWRLRTTFNLSLDDYQAMLAAQGGGCAICARPEPTGYNWHVDHCHASGVVRGLLCSKCNQGLGLFDDRTEVLTKAIKYLEDSKNLS